MPDVRYEIRPLGDWGRPVTENRAPASRFKADWDGVLADLGGEVDMLGGWLVVVQIDADASEIRRDGMLRSRARVGFPGVKISFDSNHGPLTYATDAYEQYYAGGLTSWQANVRAISLGLTALRAVDRYGITRTGEQYKGWTQIGAKAASDEMTVDEARRVLADLAKAAKFEVVPNALLSADLVRAAYRAAATKAHPDVGGNHDVFLLLGRARDTLLNAMGAR